MSLLQMLYKAETTLNIDDIEKTKGIAKYYLDNDLISNEIYAIVITYLDDLQLEEI